MKISTYDFLMKKSVKLSFFRNTLLNTPPFRPQGPPHLPPTHLPPPRHAGHPPIRHSGPPSQNYSAPPPHHQSAPAMPQPPSQPQVPNDVEIICIIKNTRNWAEFIEGIVICIKIKTKTTRSIDVA